VRKSLMLAAGLWLSAVAFPGFADTARADDSYYYGSVVCRGAQALVRFTEASNDDQPDFSTTPGTLGGALRRLKPVDPSRCKLADGSEVALKHIGLRNASGHGQCGGDESQMFSLWIGGKKIYSREVWHNPCDAPYSIAAILFSGKRLTECRIKQDESGTPDAKPICKDASSRLSQPLAETADAGTFKLVRSARGKADFCASLVRPALTDGAGMSSVFANWPARVSWPSVAVRGGAISEEGDAPELSIDFDNDGSVDHAFRIAGDTNYFNGQFWMIPPRNASEADSETVAGGLRDDPDKAAAMRTKGMRIFAGDQTAYHEPRYVRLTPFSADGQTFLHAAWATPRLDLPDDLVLRPNANGGLDEICAWQAIPPL
jgi:hypothetical protein